VDVVAGVAEEPLGDEALGGIPKEREDRMP